MGTEKLRDFWLTDEYKSYSMDKFDSSTMEANYEFLMNDLFEELGSQGVAQRLEEMLQIHNKIVDGLEIGSSGRQRYARKQQLKSMKAYVKELDILTLSPTSNKWELVFSILGMLAKFNEDIGSSTRKYPKEILQELKKEKNEKAKQYLEMGTGRFSKEDIVWRSDIGQCSCNDVFNTVTLKPKGEETEETYRYFLSYLMHVMKLGFTKEYKMAFSSKTKDYLPIISLKKTPAHNFWVNCAKFENLHPMMEEYVQFMVDNCEYYSDCYDDDRARMATGGYAVMALVLALPQYGQLLIDYATQKQGYYAKRIIPAGAIRAYLAKWGINAKTLDVALAFLSTYNVNGGDPRTENYFFYNWGASTQDKILDWSGEINIKDIDFGVFKDTNMLKELNRREDVKRGTLGKIVEYTWLNKKKVCPNCDEKYSYLEQMEQVLKNEIDTAQGEYKVELEKLAKRFSECAPIR